MILDEPTAALGVAETAEVLALIHRLRERGLGVVVISHNLDTVFDVADRIVVLRLGRRVATFERRHTTREQVVAAILDVRDEVTPSRSALDARLGALGLASRQQQIVLERLERVGQRRGRRVLAQFASDWMVWLAARTRVSRRNSSLRISRWEGW